MLTQQNAAASSVEIIEEEPHSGNGPKKRDFLRAYTTSLAVIGIIIPMIAIAATLTLYLSPPSWLHTSASTWLAVGFGFIFTCVVWLFAAVCLSKFTTMEHANARFHSILTSRLQRLATHLEVLSKKEKDGDVIEKEAYAEAKAYYKDADTCLNKSIAGLRWVSGSGYLNTWSTIHRAEEALILIEPPAIVIHGALHDKLFIQSSTMSNRDELLPKLIRAVNQLDPAAHAYFEENQLDELMQLIKQYNKIHNRTYQANSPRSRQTSTHTDISHKKAQKIEARITLRETRRAMNDFRDSRWENILHLRNQLIRALVFAELVAYILLCFVLFNLQIQYRDALVAAVAFYIVGAIAGLFGRFYSESEHTDFTNDYGLSIARLAATPLFSGLAGISGAFITVVLTVLSGQKPSDPTTMLQIFRLEPLNLFIAAVFGLTPNLVMRSLWKQAETYKPDRVMDEAQSTTVRLESDHKSH